MTRAEIRQLINDGIKVLGNQISFGSGRITEFNKDRSKEYPFIWLESLSNNPDVIHYGAHMDHWKVVLHIAMKDKIDSSADEYEDIIDKCDLIAQKLTKIYVDSLESAKLVDFDSTERMPFIHKHADDTSGVILSFTINVPDTTNVC
jgi:hypothetical protein